MTDLPPPSPGSPPPPPGPPGPQGSPAVPAAAVAVPRPLGKRRSAWLVILLTIVTCGIWTLVWSYQNGEELKRYTDRGLGGGIFLLFTLLLSPVTMFLLASEVEQRYREDGQEPPITTLWGLWFLLPIIGNLIWYLRIQDAINNYWTAHGQTNDPGL